MITVVVVVVVRILMYLELKLFSLIVIYSGYFFILKY
jgi:hypothetical protein